MKKLKLVRGVALSLACMMTTGSMALALPAQAAEIVPEEAVTAQAVEIAPEAVVEPEAVEIVPEAVEAQAVEITEAAELTEDAAEATEVIAEEMMETGEIALAGDSIANAADLPVNATVNGTFIYDTSKIQYYKVTLPSAGYVNLRGEVKKGYNIPEFILYNADEKAVVELAAKIESDVKRSNTVGLDKGTYYVTARLTSGAFSVLDYALTVEFTASEYWEKEFNEDAGHPTPISLNTFYSGTINTYKDVDYYRFDLPSDGKVVVEFDHKTLSYDYGLWVAYLQTAADETIDYYKMRGDDTVAQETDAFGLPAGTHFIKVEGNGALWNAEPYKFKVHFTPNSSINGEWEREYNDNLKNANKVAVNSNVYGNIMKYNDYDYYCFDVNEQSKVSLTIEHKRSDKTYNLWEVYLLNGAEEKLTHVYSKGAENSATSPEVTLNKGRYYVKLNGNGSLWTRSDYTLKVNVSAVKTSATKGTWKKAKNGKYWYDLGSGKYPASKWLQIDGKYYYFDKSGYMVTGWKKIGKKWYYFGGKKDGAMKTGWKKISGKWYYLDKKSGAMKTGWLQDGGKWYYLDKKTGAMKTGWLKSGGKWYYLNGKGVMLTNTSRKIGKKTYRFDKNGVCTNA